VKVKIFKSAPLFRAWLEKNHARVSELWVGMYNQRSGKKSITYKEALDEALCFAWIDGVRKSVDEATYTVRFTPRKTKSYWSKVNLKRMGELIKLGRVEAPGLAAHRRRERKSARYSFENAEKKLDSKSERAFRANPAGWEFFSAQAPWYRRTASFWVISAKKEETRNRRLQTLIRDSENGRRIGMLNAKKNKPK
jgi:uncharacterized protein YdeI (YjbR/CyaY-like superfamily)